MRKYHIALSFAGEDRDYVELVANELTENGVKVFYDNFEDTKLWGKDLYEYLTDIYKNRAIYTIMFVSEAYKNKLWTNHERKSAQARAFTEMKEYILPAKFDKSVEIPGLLNTTGYMDLNKLTANEFAQKVLLKLRDDGVELSIDTKFPYSKEAKADIDFPMSTDDKATKIIRDLRSCNWYTQAPAIESIFRLTWEELNSNQVFVIGRNIYQCACGDEREALKILGDLRKKMALLPIDVAENLINGMFYEVYFNSEGKFRGKKLKSECISKLFNIQTVDKYSNCISFIRKALQPYRKWLAIFPNTKPEIVTIKLKIEKKDPPIITSFIFSDKEMLVEATDNDSDYLWRLLFKKFDLGYLKSEVSKEWHIPIKQINIETDKNISDGMKFSLLKGKMIES